MVKLLHNYWKNLHYLQIYIKGATEQRRNGITAQWCNRITPARMNNVSAARLRQSGGRSSGFQRSTGYLEPGTEPPGICKSCNYL